MEQARERAGLAEQQADELRSKLRGAVEEGEAAAKRVTLLETQLVEALAAAGRLVGVSGGGGDWGTLCRRGLAALWHTSHGAFVVPGLSSSMVGNAGGAGWLCVCEHVVCPTHPWRRR